MKLFYDRCNNLKIYYLTKFRNDLNDHTVLRRELIKGDNVFTKISWLEALRNLSRRGDDIHFIFSMFVTIAVDQTMFCHFSENTYKAFQEHTGYPKYRYQDSNVNQNPFHLLRDAATADPYIVSYDSLEDFYRPAARLLIHEVHDYLDDYRQEMGIDIRTFIDKFVNDQDIYKFVFYANDPLSDFSRLLMVFSEPYAIR